MNFKIRVFGVDAVQDLLDQIVDASHEVIAALAEDIHERAVDLADVHTSAGGEQALVKSLGHGPRKDGDGWIVEHDLQKAPHAVFVHWGTRDSPDPVLPIPPRKALRFPVGTGQDSGFVFATSAIHKGFEGDPWMIEATDDAVRNFDALARSILP